MSAGKSDGLVSRLKPSTKEQNPNKEKKGFEMVLNLRLS